MQQISLHQWHEHFQRYFASYPGDEIGILQHGKFNPDSSSQGGHQRPWYIRCKNNEAMPSHYNDVIMSELVSQITSLTIVYSTVYSGVDHRKHQSPTSLAFVWGLHRWPVNSPHQGPVTRILFPFDDVIMFQTATTKLISVSIYDRNGRCIFMFDLINSARQWLTFNKGVPRNMSSRFVWW